MRTSKDFTKEVDKLQHTEVEKVQSTGVEKVQSTGVEKVQSTQVQKVQETRIEELQDSSNHVTSSFTSTSANPFSFQMPTFSPVINSNGQGTINFTVNIIMFIWKYGDWKYK